MLAKMTAKNQLTLPKSVTVPGHSSAPLSAVGGGPALETITRQRQSEIQRDISKRNARFFETEADKLDGWADDLKLGLEREIKNLDRQIKEARRAASTAVPAAASNTSSPTLNSARPRTTT